MNIFYTSSVEHIVKDKKWSFGSFIIKRFSDGEIYVKIEESVDEAWVIASTFPPADNLIELFLLLDALRNIKAKINLLIPYFGYARQSHPLYGEAASARVMCTFLKTFNIHKIYIIHVHTNTMHEFLSFESVIPFELICSLADDFDAIASSDRGSAALATSTASRCHKDIIFIEKKRPRHEEVEVVSIKGEVHGKRILIVDDIIATGRTIMSAAAELKKRGAASVSAYATHAFFSQSAVKVFEKSAVDALFVTNTVPVSVSSHQIKVVDISPVLQKIIYGG